MELSKLEAQTKSRSSLDEVSKFETGEKKRPPWLTAEEEKLLNSMFFEIYPDKNGFVDWSIKRPEEEQSVENISKDKGKTEKSCPDQFKFKVPKQITKKARKKLERNLKHGKKPALVNHTSKVSKIVYTSTQTEITNVSFTKELQVKSVLNSAYLTPDVTLKNNDSIDSQIVDDNKVLLSEPYQETQNNKKLNTKEEMITQEIPNQSKLSVCDKIVEIKHNVDKKLDLEILIKRGETETTSKDCDEMLEALTPCANIEQVLKKENYMKLEEIPSNTEKQYSFMDCDNMGFELLCEKSHVKRDQEIIKENLVEMEEILSQETSSQTKLKTKKLQSEKSCDNLNLEVQNKDKSMKVEELLPHETENQSNLIDCNKYVELRSEKLGVNLEQEINEDHTIEVKNTLLQKTNKQNKLADCNKNIKLVEVRKSSEKTCMNLDQEKVIELEKGALPQEKNILSKLGKCDNIVELSNHKTCANLEIKVNENGSEKKVNSHDTKIKVQKASIQNTTFNISALRTFRFSNLTIKKAVETEKEQTSDENKNKNVEGKVTNISYEMKMQSTAVDSSDEKNRAENLCTGKSKVNPKVNKDSKIILPTKLQTSNPTKIYPKRNLASKKSQNSSPKERYPKRRLSKVDYSLDLIWDKDFDSTDSNVSPVLPKDTSNNNLNGNSSKEEISEIQNPTLVAINKGNKKFISASTSSNSTTEKMITENTPNSQTINKPTETEDNNSMVVSIYKARCKNKCCNVKLTEKICHICNKELLNCNFLSHVKLVHSSHISTLNGIETTGDITNITGENSNVINNQPQPSTIDTKVKCVFCNNYVLDTMQMITHVLIQHEAFVTFDPPKCIQNKNKQLNFSCICHICNQNCMNIFKYMLHMKCQHNFQLICNINLIDINCKIQKTKITTLVNENKHSDIIDNFICYTCEKSFKIKEDLSNHIKINHLKIRCDACQYQFKNKNEYDMHIQKNDIKIHNNETLKIEYHYLGLSYKILCVKCNSWFCYKAGLGSHIRQHIKNNKIADNDKLFICKTCKISFKTKVEISEHIKLKKHLNSVQYKCNSCKYVYQTQLEYKNHIEIRNLPNNDNKTIKIEHHKYKVKSFKILCVFCNEWFTNHAGISHHLRHKHDIIQNTVNPNKNVNCPHLGCEFESRSSSALLRHLSTQHSTSRK